MSTKLAENANRRFAAHETFAPRFGWLRKAYQQVVTDIAKDEASLADAIDADDANTVDDSSGGKPSPRPTGSDIFLRKNAPVELGVGKNMVNAIRYWSQAFGVTVERPAVKSSRAMHAHPTPAGTWLLSDDGADPWLEDPASLWLLHWWLLRRTSVAPTWWVAFNLLPSQRFTEDELVSLVDQQVALAGWDSVTRSSIEKDVDCLTKMYAARRSAANSPGSVEDLLDCPFRELGLLEAVPGPTRRWRFVDVPRLAVPAAIAAYAALDFMAHNDRTGQVEIAILAHEPGAVGRALRLTEPALVAALEQIAAEHPALRVTDALGQRSLVVDGAPRVVAEQVLAAYYGREATTPAPDGPTIDKPTSKATSTTTEKTTADTETSAAKPGKAATSSVGASGTPAAKRASKRTSAKADSPKAASTKAAS